MMSSTAARNPVNGAAQRLLVTAFILLVLKYEPELPHKAANDSFRR